MTFREPRVIFTVTAVRFTDRINDSRCWGFFPSLELAHTAVQNNSADLFERGHFNYAVVEAIDMGLNPYPVEKSWWEYLRNARIVKIDKPLILGGAVNWAMG